MDTCTTTAKIWLLLDSSGPGGIESHVLQLAQGLMRHDANPKVVFMNHYGPHPLRDTLDRSAVPTMTLDGRFNNLWQTLRKDKPVLVHTHGYKAGIYGRIAARLNGVPVVSTYHAGEVPSGKLALYDWIDRKTGVLANKIYAVSRQIAHRLPKEAELADNFVDTDRINPSFGHQIAFVGRLSHEKGPDRFLGLAGRFPEQSFHVYGDGPLKTELIDKAPPNVRFHGQQADMAMIWPRIGLLVMPSRYEGLPMAALEGMARGIPLLAYRVGAIDQLVSGNSGGWSIEPGNAEALVKHLAHWLRLRENEKRRICAAAKDNIDRRFSSNIAIPKVISQYRQTIAGCEG